ncbi:hypothetical protein N7488_006076 [Penicillium malachiteum]|nr:hypothetical protein N7488_006076 [Penicillium malachiteum]
MEVDPTSRKRKRTNTEGGLEDEHDELEQEIDLHEYMICGYAVKIRLSLIDDDERDFDQAWVMNYVAECNCNGVFVATALVRYFHRKEITPWFWEKMQEESEGMCSFAFEVFDHRGDLMKKYKKHPVLRGTGVWRSELDRGPLLFFEKVDITASELRGKGLEKRVVSLLLEKIQKLIIARKRLSKGLGAVALFGMPLDKSPEERLMIQYKAEAVTIDFWRSCGFRRIGASDCFAFSFNADHPSHNIAAAFDFNPRRSYARDLENQKLRVIYEADSSIGTNKLRIKRLRNALPLHRAALTLTDKELMAFFVTHVDDKLGWDRVDNSEATLLHLTACGAKPLSLQWLLENIRLAAYWKTARDIDGYTPFEALQEKLEKMRTQRNSGPRRIKIVSDKFGGHPETAVSCLCLLSGQNSLANKACFRYGCTCGECVEGFLSAKMRRSLILQVKRQWVPEYMLKSMDDGIFWSSYPSFSKSLILDQLAPVVDQRLATKNSQRGFVQMFQLVVYCLKSGKTPTVQNLEWCHHKLLKEKGSEWAPNKTIGSYIRRVGARKGCQAVLRLMFEGARDDAEDIMADIIPEDLDLAGKPTCRNDYEFEFVARTCGY